MTNIKNVFSIIIVLTGIIVFFGCGENPQPVSGLPSSSASLQREQPLTKEELKPYMVTTSTGIYNQQTAGTEQGCYAVLQNSTGAHNLFYVDYATKQLVYLSNNPASLHNTEEDPSFLGLCPGGASLFATDEHLYLVILGGTFGGERISVPAQIIQMSFNGSTKKNLYSFDEGQFLENTAFACDGKNLYFLVHEIAAKKNLLIRVSTKTGKSKTLAEFEGNGQCQLLGTSEDALILQTFTPEKEQKYALVSVSLRDGMQTELMRWNFGEWFVAIYEGTGYAFSTSEGSLYQISLITGEQTACFDLPLSMENEEQYRLISDAHDGHLFFLEQNTNDLFTVACKTGAAKKISLQKNGFNASIVATTKDAFLVFPEYKSFDYTIAGSEGALQKQQLVLPHYALISKANFWNSIPEYSYISYDNFIA